MKFLGLIFVALTLVVLTLTEEAPPADVELIEPKSVAVEAKPSDTDKKTAKRGAYYGYGIGYGGYGGFGGYGGYGGYYGGYYPYYSGYYHYPYYSYGYGYGYPYGGYYF